VFVGITVSDKKKFVQSVIRRKLDLQAIVSEARAEIRQIGSPPIRPVGSSDYVRFLHILVFFLISEVKVRPANLSGDNSRFLFRVARYLVDRHSLNPDVLELFRE